MDNRPLNDLLLLSKYLLKKGKFILIFASLEEVLIKPKYHLKILTLELSNVYIRSFKDAYYAPLNVNNIVLYYFKVVVTQKE